MTSSVEKQLIQELNFMISLVSIIRKIGQFGIHANFNSVSHLINVCILHQNAENWQTACQIKLKLYGIRGLTKPVT